MPTKRVRARVPMPIRWDVDDWAYVGDVARSSGLSRSAFVREAALAAAKATAAGLGPYSVIAAQAATQNTAANPFSPSRAKQEEGKKDSRRSRTRLAPEVISGPILEKLGRDGVSNGASKKAGRLRGLRS